MSSWVFLISRDQRPADASLPLLLATAGHDVTAVLTDDSLTGSLPSAQDHLEKAGVEVLIDQVAATRRGLQSRATNDTLVNHDEIAALVLDPTTRVVWT